MDPLEWGWRNHEGRLVPIKTDLHAAPKELLQSIRCSCKTGCASKRCSCKKHGIPCTTACKECKGVGCKNRQHLDPSDDNTMFLEHFLLHCNVMDMHILFCIAISINLIKLSKLEVTFTILQKFCAFCK